MVEPPKVVLKSLQSLRAQKQVEQEQKIGVGENQITEVGFEPSPKIEVSPMGLEINPLQKMKQGSMSKL